ncbi:MAG: hypothetical protein HKN87_03155 [Saprospiraceae bacterium]|nr:hypothetical protein [Saprospiraceae bacterium]
MKNYMKALRAFAILGLVGILPFEAPGQEINAVDLPGEHFCLEGALELFKESKSPKDFEKKLNAADHVVNNLDLNGDQQVDYIRVEDHTEGDVHALVLQVPISEDEQQDIAVIEIEKRDEGEAILQIVGDEDIYGEPVIIEPFEEELNDAQGPEVLSAAVRLTVNVWLWPSVRYVYRPGYRVWVSPWRWRLYPRGWTPWRPHPLGWFHANRPRYHRHFHVVQTHRVVRAHRIYTPRRRTSITVRTRHQPALQRHRGKVGTTSTQVVHKRGQTHAVKKTSTKITRTSRGNTSVSNQQTTVVKGRNGAVHGKRVTQKAAVNKEQKKGAVQRKSTKVKRTPKGKGVTTTKRTRTVKKTARKR